MTCKLAPLGLNELLGVSLFYAAKLLSTEAFMLIDTAAIAMTILMVAQTFPGHVSLSYRSDAKTFSHSLGISSDF